MMELFDTHNKKEILHPPQNKQALENCKELRRIIWESEPLSRALLTQSITGAIHYAYDIEILKAHNIPNQGPAILAMNHASFLDAFVLGSCLPYPLRFYVDEGIYRNTYCNPILKKFDAIPLSSRCSTIKNAIQKTLEAKEKEQMLCIFPEGTVTHTGKMQPLKRGIEILAKKADIPVVPVAISGLWGSVFSRKHKHSLRQVSFFRSPRKVTVSFGELIQPEQASIAEIQRAIEAML